MNKEEKKSDLPRAIEVPTIKKVVNCLKCGAKIEVEFEIDLAPLLPLALADCVTDKGLEEEKPTNGKD